eukprot:767575-Hanusia_phi.AAC.1
MHANRTHVGQFHHAISLEWRLFFVLLCFPCSRSQTHQIVDFVTVVICERVMKEVRNERGGGKRGALRLDQGRGEENVTREDRTEEVGRDEEEERRGGE